MRATLFVSVCSLLLQTTTAYTMTPLTMKARPFASSVASRVKFPSFFAATSSAESSKREVMIREFEKKEADLEKRRKAAQEQLNKYEKTLEDLQTKKAEYLAADQLAKSPPGGSFSETALRSAVKAFLWRVVAGSVTFVTTLKFSGSVSTAFKVVGADFFSKAFTMFIVERLMNKSQAGRKTGSDAAGRSLAKALIWRLFAICNTLTMAVFVSKDLSVASKIASTDAVFKTALMFVYGGLLDPSFFFCAGKSIHCTVIKLPGKIPPGSLGAKNLLCFHGLNLSLKAIIRQNYSFEGIAS